MDQVRNRISSAVSMLFLLGIPWIFSAFGAMENVHTGAQLEFLEGICQVSWIQDRILTVILWYAINLMKTISTVHYLQTWHRWSIMKRWIGSIWHHELATWIVDFIQQPEYSWSHDYPLASHIGSWNTWPFMKSYHFYAFSFLRVCLEKLPTKRLKQSLLKCNEQRRYVLTQNNTTCINCWLDLI